MLIYDLHCKFCNPDFINVKIQSKSFHPPLSFLVFWGTSGAVLVPAAAGTESCNAGGGQSGHIVSNYTACFCLLNELHGTIR